jgi:hypothetical protein
MKWSPDTCDCEIDIEQDDKQPSGWAYKGGKICTIHTSLSGQVLLDTVLSESRTKNYALGVIGEQEILAKAALALGEAQAFRQNMTDLNVPNIPAALAQAVADRISVNYGPASGKINPMVKKFVETGEKPSIDWSFDAQRKVQITVKGIDLSAEKAAIQMQIDTKVGVGKATLVDAAIEAEK